jgi:hypothetical protein
MTHEIKAVNNNNNNNMKLPVVCGLSSREKESSEWFTNTPKNGKKQTNRRNFVPSVAILEIP